MALLFLLLVLLPGSASAEYLGELSANPYLQEATVNPFGAGSPFAPNGINNPFGAGNPYSLDSPTNPYGRGLRIEGQ
jgi:hypothetical protein